MRGKSTVALAHSWTYTTKGKDTMAEYQSFIAPEFFFGEGVRHTAGTYARKLGAERVLLVSDAGSHAQAWVDDVRKSLSKAKIDYVDCSLANVSPQVKDVSAGLFMYRQSNCDVIIAIGTDSPIHCAKAIGILASNPGSLSDYAGLDRIPRPLPPLLCLPTAASASSEVSQYTIVSDPATRANYVISSKAIMPDIVLLDPQTLRSYPAERLRVKVLASLSNAIESFTCAGASLLTDLHAREAIPLLSSNLTAFMENQNHCSVQAGLMRGSLEAGLAFSNAGLGAVHAMSAALDGWFDLAYGTSSSRLLPHLIDFNYKANRQRYKEVFQLLGMRRTELNPQAWVKRFFRSYFNSLNLSPKLDLMCPSDNELRIMAGQVLADPSLANNPRAMDEAAIVEIYKSIFVKKT